MVPVTHLHFVVWVAEAKTATGYDGVTYVDVMAESMDMAIVRAKALVPGRAHYWLNNVVEHHDHEDGHDPREA